MDLLIYIHITHIYKKEQELSTNPTRLTRRVPAASFCLLLIYNMVRYFWSVFNKSNHVFFYNWYTFVELKSQVFFDFFLKICIDLELLTYVGRLFHILLPLYLMECLLEFVRILSIRVLFDDFVLCLCKSLFRVNNFLNVTGSIHIIKVSKHK